MHAMVLHRVSLICWVRRSQDELPWLKRRTKPRGRGFMSSNRTVKREVEPEFSTHLA
jgi:hypothetical protein